jgi:hypothetical protein
LRLFDRFVRPLFLLLTLSAVAAGVALAVDYQLYNSSFPHEQYSSEGTNAATSGGPTAPASVQTTISTAYPQAFATLTRDPSELYVIAGLAAPLPNYIAKVDPITLAQIKRTSLACPATDCPFQYTWAPTGVVHANGYIYVAAASRLWKLDNNLNVIGYVNLPLKDGAYNSIKVLSDGNILAKGMPTPGGTQPWSTMTLVTPDLTVLVPDLRLPEICIARITDLVHNGVEQVYITGATTVIRYTYTPGPNAYLTQDPTWSYFYRNANDTATSAGGLPTFIGNEAFFADNAQDTNPTGPIHLYRINLDNSSDNQVVTPFPGYPNGYHINKHLVDPVNGVVVISDSNNGVTAAYRYMGSGKMMMLWSQRIRSKIIAAASSATGFLYITDTTPLTENLDILNINTGQILSRTPVGPPIASTGALSIGYNKDVFYVGNLSVLTRVYNP